MSMNAVIRPWIGNLHHARELGDDWGWIRDESGDLIIIVNFPTHDEDVLNEHRRNKTDPTQERVDAILAALNRPNSAGQGREAYPKPACSQEDRT
jgi:hypothetical protein